MLTENEKLKIELEETYRIEVQKKLPKEKKSKIMAFFNSSFGLFILSPVLLGLITFLYNLNDEHIEKEKFKTELSLELHHRLKTIETINDTLEVYEFSDLMIAFYGKEVTSDKKIRQAYYSFRSFNNKFEKWSILRLVDELYTIESGRNKGTIKRLRNNFNTCYPIFKNFGKYYLYKRSDGIIIRKWLNRDTRKGKYILKGKTIIVTMNDTIKKYKSIINGKEMYYNKIYINKFPDSTKVLLKTIKEIKPILNIYKK